MRHDRPWAPTAPADRDRGAELPDPAPQPWLPAAVTTGAMIAAGWGALALVAHLVGGAA